MLTAHPKSRKYLPKPERKKIFWLLNGANVCPFGTGEIQGLRVSTTTDTQHQLVQDCQLKNIMSIPGTCQSEPIQMYLCKEARNQEVTDNLSCHDCTSLYKSIISEHVLVQDSYILYCWIKQGQRTSQTMGALAILFLVVNVLPDFKAIISKKNDGQAEEGFFPVGESSVLSQKTLQPQVSHKTSQLGCP